MIGLAPMDGITDAAFRQVVDEVGKPDILFTEFIPAEGLVRGRSTLLNGLKKHSSDTPVIAQFFGNNPEYFYQAFFIAAKQGFSGVDVNMGCPELSIVKKGSGSALINNPKRAKEIIAALQQARGDLRGRARGQMTISVKTRIGFDKATTKEWIGQLLEARPDFITVHGRIFTQKYGGKADWDEIKKAVKMAKGTKTKIWGNGDVRSREEAQNKIKEYGVDGVLVGRAALGNPWLFAGKIPTFQERLKMMEYHAKLFLEYRPDLDLRPMRKHLAWYCKGEEGSAKLREKLMKVVTMKDLQEILSFRAKSSESEDKVEKSQEIPPLRSG